MCGKLDFWWVVHVQGIYSGKSLEWLQVFPLSKLKLPPKNQLFVGFYKEYLVKLTVPYPQIKRSWKISCSHCRKWKLMKNVVRIADIYNDPCIEDARNNLALHNLGNTMINVMTRKSCLFAMENHGKNTESMFFHDRPKTKWHFCSLIFATTLHPGQSVAGGQKTWQK